MSTLRRLVRALGLQALAGLAVWTIVASVAANTETAALDLVTMLLLFGQLVIVPLGLLLVPPAGSGGRLADALARGGRFLFRIGAVAAMVALAIPRGELSAAVAAVYLVPALLVAASVALRVRAMRSPSDAATVAAGAFLAAGALLFVLHRQDVAFAGFPELAVQLTSVHLHFVGFGLMLMAGALARRSPRLGGAAVGLLVAGVPASAIGMLVHPAVEVAGAVAVTAGLAALAVGAFQMLRRPGVPGDARRLLFVSLATSLLVGAAAVASTVGARSVDVGSMARIHGGFAAIGVVFIGLLGWRLADGR